MRKHRKILISRVLILMVAGLSILCILGAVILFFTMMFKSNDSVGSTTPSPTVDVMESTRVEGTIIDATMNTLSIVTDDGRVLAFNTENVDSTSTGDGLFIDIRIRIDYQGILDDTSVEQNVVVHSVEVINGSTTPRNKPEVDPTVESTDLPQPTSTPQPTPTPTAQPTPTQDPILAKGQAILNNTSIEEKVGQTFIARCPETNATDDVSEDQLGILAILAGNDLLCCTNFQQQIS